MAAITLEWLITIPLQAALGSAVWSANIKLPPHFGDGLSPYMS